ncbi:MULTISPECIES: type II secretion system protein GspL [unclassified Caballeronia]|uniref:type II secretion system protein GspL n=1 Tax=unclassified Caballeronia TaxID=2646786 RepID=UPI0028547CCF|nr:MULTISPECIES: type II secretion system protein GspL [unclassified Caballeronia]MDR5821405.1 type II secretion system protein GspL [Caballeronia sp. LZ043]MDR5879582.1 type II secretion system protein GspL [Caballeronia sp. LZ032]
MSTLIVSLPPRDPAVRSEEWHLPDLPFLLLDKRGEPQRIGRAALGLLPRASATVLIVAARDTLLLAATVPPLKGPRLRQALPNVVEDQLIQDPQTCHIAVDPVALADGRRVVAVIDRGWFRFVVGAFAGAGHRNLKAVPAMRCLPVPTAAAAPVEPDAALDADADEGALPSTPFIAGLLGPVISTAPALIGEMAAPTPASLGAPRIEIAIARGERAALGEGLALSAESIVPTLTALAGDHPATLYSLVDLPGDEPRLASVRPVAGHVDIPGAQPIAFETLARNALASRFDLCQFEFAAQPWKLDRATVRRLRVPIALVALSVLVSIIGINVQWLQLARQRDAINAQMTELLLNAFPTTTVVLDAPDQMTRNLDRLRTASGELSPADFLSLADGLARSLGPVPVNGIAGLDYRDRHLEVTFKPDTKVDPDLTKRLAANGLSGSIDSNTGKWTIGSGQ